jgi:hypothetical protein
MARYLLINTETQDVLGLDRVDAITESLRASPHPGHHSLATSIESIESDEGWWREPCGQDFMAGQICQLPKGHDGSHR